MDTRSKELFLQLFSFSGEGLYKNHPKDKLVLCRCSFFLSVYPSHCMHCLSSFCCIQHIYDSSQLFFYALHYRNFLHQTLLFLSISAPQCHCLSASLSLPSGHVCLYLTSNKEKAELRGRLTVTEVDEKAEADRAGERNGGTPSGGVYTILNVIHQLAVTVWYKVTYKAWLPV